MKKVLFVGGVVILAVVNTACTTTPDTTHVEKDVQYFQMKSDTANMSEFDKTKYLLDHGYKPADIDRMNRMKHNSNLPK